MSHLLELSTIGNSPNYRLIQHLLYATISKVVYRNRLVHRVSYRPSCATALHGYHPCLWLDDGV